MSVSNCRWDKKNFVNSLTSSIVTGRVRQNNSESQRGKEKRNKNGFKSHLNAQMTLLKLDLHIHPHNGETHFAIYQ